MPWQEPDEPEDEDEHRRHTVAKMLRDKRYNSIGETLLHEKVEYLLALVKWWFGIVSALVVIGIAAAVSDHFYLAAVIDSQKEMKEIVHDISERTNKMWYGGKYDGGR